MAKKKIESDEKQPKLSFLDQFNTDCEDIEEYPYLHLLLNIGWMLVIIVLIKFYQDHILRE